MLRLLAPVCRDCGKSGDKVLLSRYLNFQLCEVCVDRRERAMREGAEPSRRRRGRGNIPTVPADGEKVPKGSPRKRKKT